MNLSPGTSLPKVGSQITCHAVPSLAGIIYSSGAGSRISRILILYLTRDHIQIFH